MVYWRKTNGGACATTLKRAFTYAIRRMPIFFPEAPQVPRHLRFHVVRT